MKQVRDDYPALADGYAYLDGAAGTQVPMAVINALADTYRAGIGYSGGVFPASQRSTAIVADCRAAVADLVGGHPDGVILGPNMTTLTYHIAQTLARNWQLGDEIVVSQLDHDANVRPWVQAAATAKATVRWACMDPATGCVPAEQYKELLSSRTRLVAVTAASNVLGIRPDVAAITAQAHIVGALTFVDGVHATPHGPIDMTALGADFYATSAYKWYGPHVSAVIAEPRLLDTLSPLKLAPSADRGPEQLERGALPIAYLAGLVAAVDYLASLSGLVRGSRGERLRSSMGAIQVHEQNLFGAMLRGLESMPHVTLYGGASERTPTAFFNVAGMEPGAVAEHLATRRINVWSGHLGAWEVAGVLGIRDSGGAVRASLSHYSDRSDVERLLEGVAGLA
jgi:cysteine desulfurase family protein (TIGR01976 family)